MARVVKPEEYTARRNEILNTALQLLYTKGYEKMTIQDILDRLQMSKGAFYHYFDSKVEVLDALVEHMVEEQVEPLLISIVRDPDLTALEKLQRYFDTAVRWKTSQKDLIMALLKIWYSDDNALARQKMYASMVTQVKPLFMEIIGQGAEEGIFSTPYPAQASEISIGMIQSLGDTFARMLLAEAGAEDHSLQEAESLMVAYNDALERILGAPKGSIHLMDSGELAVWFAAESAPSVKSKVKTKRQK